MTEFRSFFCRLPRVLAVSILLLASWRAHANDSFQDPDVHDRKHFVGSSLFVLANLIPFDDPPHFYQLNVGYRLTAEDTLSVEAITWTYKGPLGRPYGDDWENTRSDFPGDVRAYGVGLAYQRYWWRGVYTQIHATLFRQSYLDEDGTIIQRGFQLFSTVRLGYHFQLFDNRIFLEPSIACTAWPINTNLPDAFQKEEDKWPSYFLFEPGLHVGINF